MTTKWEPERQGLLHKGKNDHRSILKLVKSIEKVFFFSFKENGVVITAISRRWNKNNIAYPL